MRMLMEDVTIQLTVEGNGPHEYVLTPTTSAIEATGCEPAFRGRVMSMYMMTIGLLPLGTIPAGAMADAWGVPVALMGQGGLMAAIFALLWLSRSRVRTLD